MAEYLIYKHTSPSGKAYIGQTKNLRQRNASHKLPCVKPTPFHCAIQKYGWDAFKHEVLIENLTLEEANKLEEQLIQEHNTMVPHGYNLRSGGENQLIAEDVKQRWSEQRKGKPRSPEHQEKLNNAARNRIRSPEHSAKLLAAVQKPKSEEHKRKMSETHKGKPKSEEHKRKNSEYMKMFVQTEEGKQRIERNRTRLLGSRWFIDPNTGKRTWYRLEQLTTSPTDTTSSSA